MTDTFRNEFLFFEKLTILKLYYSKFFISTVVHKTTIACHETTQSTFKKIWQSHPGDKDNLFKTLICPRNVMLLAQSGNVAKSWDTLAKFSVFLLNQKLMTSETFETQCVGIFKHEWDAVSLKHLTGCFNAFLGYYASSGASASKFTLLMEFLSQFCYDFGVEWLFFLIRVCSFFIYTRNKCRIFSIKKVLIYCIYIVNKNIFCVLIVYIMLGLFYLLQPHGSSDLS